jgi:hypothetical protein
MPIEINRKLTPLSTAAKWKNRQKRNFFIYMSVMLLLQFKKFMNDTFLLG